MAELVKEVINKKNVNLEVFLNQKLEVPQIKRVLHENLNNNCLCKNKDTSYLNADSSMCFSDFIRIKLKYFFNSSMSFNADKGQMFFKGHLARFTIVVKIFCDLEDDVFTLKSL